jgi:hypothetical protein
MREANYCHLNMYLKNEKRKGIDHREIIMPVKGLRARGCAIRFS